MRRSRSKCFNYGIAYHKGTSFPILAQGQADDLISDSGRVRVWKSRVNGKISTEIYNSDTGMWELQ
jgi:hypothetical protein